MIAVIEPLVNLLAEGEGVDEAVLAGGAFVADHRPHFRAGASGFQAALGEELPQGFNVAKGDVLDFRVSRVVMATWPLPNFSAASVTADSSSAVSLPLR